MYNHTTKYTIFSLRWSALPQVWSHSSYSYSRFVVVSAPQEWIDIANAELQTALKMEKIISRPKNVVFFLGDGMGIATLTAARIYKGQLGGKNGEEGALSFEKFPYVGLSKVPIPPSAKIHF